MAKRKKEKINPAKPTEKAKPSAPESGTAKTPSPPKAPVETPSAAASRPAKVAKPTTKPAAAKATPPASSGKKAAATKPAAETKAEKPVARTAAKPAKAKTASPPAAAASSAKKPAGDKVASAGAKKKSTKAASTAKRASKTSKRRAAAAKATKARSTVVTVKPADSVEARVPVSAVASTTVAPAPPPEAPRPSPPLPTFLRDLPETYGDTRLVALVRDPEWVFLYWEIADSARQRFGIPRGRHSKPMALRVFDVTGLHFDGLNAHSFYDVEINDMASSWYLRMPETDRAYVMDLGVYAEDGTFQILARSNAVQVPPSGMSEVADEHWMTVTDAQFAEIVRMSGGFRLREQHGSAEFGRRRPDDLAAELRRQWVGSGMWSGASEALPPAPKARADFWLEVDCDVIVYGATQPDATVTLQGERILLSPDGRFHARFTLPDGKFEFPVRAVSADGRDVREIAPVVTRKTKT